jgi:hypothetical protein
LRETDSGGSGLALFFPAESAVPASPGDVSVPAGSPVGATDNFFTGRVLETVFSGRFRRLRLACRTVSAAAGAEATEPVEIEIEVPTETCPARGDFLSFRIPPEDCILLPEGN